VAKFEAKISIAKKFREGKIKELKEAKRQAGAAAAAVKRKEEQRRINRERRQGEIQCQEEEERQLKEELSKAERRRREKSLCPEEKQLILEVDGLTKARKDDKKISQKDGVEHSRVDCDKNRKDGAASVLKTRKRGRRSRKGSEFFLPQNQEVSDEERTPAQPKCLLSSFTEADDTERASTSQSSDKRVRWEDEGSNDGDGCSEKRDTLMDDSVAVVEKAVPEESALPKSRKMSSIHRSPTEVSADANQRRYPKAHRPRESEVETKDANTLSTEQPEIPSKEPFDTINVSLISRRKKQYGSSKKGLVAISGSKGVAKPFRRSNPGTNGVIRAVDSTISSKASKKIPELQATGGPKRRRLNKARSEENFRSNEDKNESGGSGRSTNGKKEKSSSCEHKISSSKNQSKKLLKNTATKSEEELMSRSKRHSAVIQQARRQSKASKHKNLHFDSLNSHGAKEASVTPKNANKSASSRNGCSRSSGSASSKSRQASATRRGSSGKRSFHEIRNTQAPGLPSSERANKVRRRKKKETVPHRKSSSKSLADDAYDFHF